MIDKSQLYILCRSFLFENKENYIIPVLKEFKRWNEDYIFSEGFNIYDYEKQLNIKGLFTDGIYFDFIRFLKKLDIFE